MNKSESIAALAAALAKAQAEMENAHKTSSNPHFKSKYADLAEIINTVRPVLAAHGLSVVQFIGLEAGVAIPIVTVETVLMHSSGEWMSSVAAAPLSKPDAQGVGSVTTYLRRYSLAAVTGIAQEDDDGNAASRKPSAESVKAALRPNSLTASEMADHRAAIEAADSVDTIRQALNAACVHASEPQRAALQAAASARKGQLKVSA